MLHRIVLLTLLMAVCFPAGALAHGGHGEVKYRQQVMAGPYPLTIEYNQWPVRPGMHVEVAVVPEGGIDGKTGKMKVIPAPNVFRRSGVGRVDWEVADLPGFPVWLGWLIGLFPLYGLIWFILREWRRVRGAIARDGGANL